jgi:hypothetical protein
MKASLQPPVISQCANWNEDRPGYDRRKYFQAAEPFVRNEDQPAKKAEDSHYFDHARSIQPRRLERKLSSPKNGQEFPVHGSRFAVMGERSNRTYGIAALLAA